MTEQERELDLQLAEALAEISRLKAENETLRALVEAIDWADSVRDELE